MSDDVQNTSNPSTEDQPQDNTTSGKNKKINRLTLSVLNTKIKDLEEKNQKNSRYYKHLLIRQKDIEKSSS